ncbi:MAG: hypothetical protein KKA65_02670 [Nanoarchaeota archaeon]|nr:hypothetical protein [Nanoarchaeota archaeon]MBU4352632.1 hypothetical protein [Nanoarchaeota archaeon]MBU4456381.1 hypothetical protein [Nanoarchaeota archaeon]MCG2719150.1 hypothetical protein [Nanoarchaeota archaeon]
MGNCTYTGLIGLILDEMPSKEFIHSFNVKDLLKITKHYCGALSEGTSSCYWGLEHLDFAKAVDLKDEIAISLRFKKNNGLFVPQKNVCKGNSCAILDDNQAAMMELLTQCLPYIPKKRKGSYFILTPFEKGCCEFKGGTINIKLEEIKNLINTFLKF